MTNPQGPGSPFQLLFDDDPSSEPSLPPAFRQIYGGDWRIPQIPGRPYTYTNFAQSRDGRISFNEPGLSTGGDVTGFNAHDRWLMGLLRTRADAVMSGDVTINLETEHIWSAEFICPSDASAFSALRQVEEYAPMPLLVILSLDGKLNFEGACFKHPDARVLLATTARGVAQVQDLPCPATVDLHNLGTQSVDLQRLMQILYSDYGVRNLLCEGGARAFASMLDAGLIDEEFVTFCPNFIGRTHERFRPSYTEGVAWLPTTAPYSKPISLRRAGDFLFMQTRCQYRK